MEYHLNIVDKFLTGIIDVDYEILLNLDDKSLRNIFRINKHGVKLFKLEYFWKLRIIRKYKVELSIYGETGTYKQIYQKLRDNGNHSYKNMVESSRLGYLPLVEKFLEEGGCVQYLDSYFSQQYDSPLYRSALDGHLDILKYLRSKVKEDIQRIDNKLLKSAAYEGHVSIVKYLIEETGRNDHTIEDLSLIENVKNGDLCMVQYLIEEAGVNANAYYGGAISNSAKYGRLSILKYLIEKVGYIHSINDNVLRMAAREGHLSIVKYLIETSLKKSLLDDTVLYSAAEKGQINIVKYLIEEGNANNYTWNCNAALHGRNYYDILTYLRMVRKWAKREKLTWSERRWKRRRRI